MRLTTFCIMRPVFATVLSLVLVVAGLMGLHSLTTRYLPRFESNHLTITAVYPGASATLMETSVTTPLEEAISGTQGIDTVASSSSQNTTQIDITLQDGVNVTAVMEGIRAQVENARSGLPPAVSSPQVQLRNTGAMDLVDIGVIQPGTALPALRDYLQRNVVAGLRQLNGVAAVNIAGANPYVLQIRLDPKQMAARHVSLADIQAVIASNTLALPAGKIHGSFIDYPVTVDAKINTPAQFEQLVIKQYGNRSIYLRDIAHVQMDTDPTSDSAVRINAMPGLLLSITATDDANPINTARAIHQYLQRLTPQLPQGLQFVTVYDQSVFMQQSIHEVYQAIVFAILCVLLVIMGFLADWRAVLVPVVTIPICVIATFALLYALGYTLNVITLLALVLSIGLVVDDAIVMLENITRYVEQGMAPLAAALKGSREIAFAVVAMTLTLAAVYAPVGFVQGKMAAVFKPFAFTLAGAVIISGLVALTLSPMMCARWLRRPSTTSRYRRSLDHGFRVATRYYQRVLEWFLQQRFALSITLSLLVVAGGLLVRTFSFGFMPDEDMGLVIAQTNLPSGASMQTITRATAQASQVLQQQAGIETVLSIADTGAHAVSFGFATLKPFAERKVSAREVANQFNDAATQVPGLSAFAFPISFGGSMKSQLQFVITSDKSYAELSRVTQRTIEQLKQNPKLQNLTSNLNFDSQQYNVSIKRDLAAQLQVNMQDIHSLIMAMLGGVKLAAIDVAGQYYDVLAMGQPIYQQGFQYLDTISVLSATGQAVPLANLLTITPTLEQDTLMHVQRQRAATLNATLAPDYTLGEAVRYLQRQLPAWLPDGVHFSFQGAAKTITETSNSVAVVFGLALVCIYLVLCAQFESFIDPLVILLAVPFSVIGALLGLKLINGGINLYTLVGLVTLIGLVAKHGILITQFANQLMRSGMSPRAAVVEAALLRLRPILMTTAAMVVGALPLTFASGAGAASRQQIGMVITSGLLFGTFFSLILVPGAYTFMHKVRARWRKSLPAAAANTIHQPVQCDQ